MTLKITWLAGYCPVQSEGFFDEYPYYFRARGDRWYIDLCMNPKEKEDLDAYVTVDGGDYGPWPAAGWMDLEVARTYIILAYFNWKKKKAGESPPSL